MPTPIWPTGLPQNIQHNSYEETLPEGTIRTEMDEGPAKTRRLPTANYPKVTGDLILTRDQVDLLKTFYRDTVAGGALFFEWKELLSTDTIRREYRFTEPPSWRMFGADTLVASIALEKKE